MGQPLGLRMPEVTSNPSENEDFKPKSEFQLCFACSDHGCECVSSCTPTVGPLSIQCSFAVHWEEFDQFQVGSGAGPLFGPAERDRVAGRLVRLRRALYRPLRRLPNSPSAFRHVSRGTSVFSILLLQYSFGD